MELSAFSQCQQVWPHSTCEYPLGLLRSYHCHTTGTSRGDYNAMKDDPTIAAIREARSTQTGGTLPRAARTASGALGVTPHPSSGTPRRERCLTLACS